MRTLRSKTAASRLLAGMLILMIAAMASGQTFTQIPTGDIAIDHGKSQYAGWNDYDKDGDLDLLVPSHQTGENYVYINDGNGNMTRDTNSLFAKDYGATNCALWGDLNNDGFEDLIMTNFYQDSNVVYLNDGQGGFTQLHTAFSDDSLLTTSVSLLDYDRDGFLDVFLTHYDDVDHLFRNNEGNYFTRVFAGTITSNNNVSMNAAISDINHDGYPDIFVSCGRSNPEPNHLYLGSPSGTFVEVTTGHIITDNSRSVAASWGDYNNDLLPDLFVVNRMDMPLLYLNNGNANFTKVTTVSFGGSNSRDCSWADIDNDGDLDLYQTYVPGSNYLYMNNGGSLMPTSNSPITTDAGESKGHGWADFDNDGDLDLYVANDFDQQNYLYINSGTSNNYFRVKCEGTQSNASGIGARILIVTNSAFTPIKQMREIISHTYGRGTDGLIAHFGLGLSPQIDTLTVLWPSGQIDEYYNLTANQQVTLVEGTGIITATKPEPQQNTALIHPNPFSKEISLNIKDGSTLKIIDISGKLVKDLPYTQQLDLSGLDAGIYFITVYDKQGSMLHLQKMVKE